MGLTGTEAQTRSALGLHAGDWVEVRSAAEVLATLDDRGRLDELPFMPEMLQYCGRRFRVYKTAHKTCDTIQSQHSRGMSNAVHLEGLRCDGAGHGGCQALCLLYWKEAWLQRVSGPAESGAPRVESPNGLNASPVIPERLERATRRDTTPSEGAEVRYSCQATALRDATTAIPPGDTRHYIQDLTSGNVSLVNFVRFALLAGYNRVMRLHWRGRPYPHVRGRASKSTPAAELNLQPGDLVQVRSKDEIMDTLNEHNRNRGLSFDVEMIPYCGRTFRVLSRVDRIIDEKSGRMMRMRSPCIILESVTCGGYLSPNRMFCPRAIYPYWHEIWLKRVESPSSR